MSENYILAFLLALLAGLSTGIGSAIALFFNKTNTKFLAFSLGLSAGVMIYVSFMELLPIARSEIESEFGSREAYIIAAAAFFVGIAVSFLLDRLIPQPHEATSIGDIKDKSVQKSRKKRLMRVGVLTALALAVHNFPEGLATFVAAVNNINIGISIALAIAIHNIPEGIAVSVPVYHATGNKKVAFIQSFVSGLAEPVGAVIGFLFLMNFMNPITLGLMFAFVAGIMIYISMDELLPTAEEYGEHHLAVYGFVAGLFIMALSLILVI